MTSNMRDQDSLRAHFRPEFINRIDEIVCFHSLDEEHIKQIVDIQLRGLLKRLSDRKITVELSDAAKDFLVREGYDPVYGARPLKRALQRRLLDPLALRVLEGAFREGDTVAVDVSGDELRFAKGHDRSCLAPRFRPAAKNAVSSRPKPTALWWVLGVLTLLAIGQAYFLAPAGRQISYSEFKGLVRGGQVAEVAVGDTIIHGTLKKAENGATAFTTTRIEDPKLVEELDAAQREVFGRDRQPLAARRSSAGCCPSC